MTTMMIAIGTVALAGADSSRDANGGATPRPRAFAKPSDRVYPQRVADRPNHMIDLLRNLLGSSRATPAAAADDHAFDREKAAFEQNCQQFRHLNEQMNKVPPFAVTLTGGFWYVSVLQRFSGPVTPELEATARFSLMIFAAITDLMLVLIAIRIRDVMKGYQDKMMAFMGTWAPEARRQSFLWYRDYSMISMYATMMLAAAVLSLIGAFVLFWPRMGVGLCYAIGGVIAVSAILIFISNGLPKWLTRQS